MAALMNSVPLQSSFKPCGQKQSGQRRALVCRAESRSEGAWTRTAGVSLLAAGLAATVLINTPAPANAGVVYEQPKLKRARAFQKKDQVAEDQVQQESKDNAGGGFSLPSLPSPSLPGLPTPSLPTSFPFPALPEVDTSGGIDPRAVALPGAVAGIAAAGYAAYSLDGGFRSMIRESLVKDSTGYAGYEETIKGDPNSTQYIGPAVKGTKKVGNTKPIKKTVKGTKRVVKGKASDKKGGILGIFN